MSAKDLGQDCCSDRYEVLSQYRCRCGCDLCYCQSCYHRHCASIVESLYPIGTKGPFGRRDPG